MKKLSGLLETAIRDIDVGTLKIADRKEYQCQTCKDTGLIINNGKALQCQCTKQKNQLAKFAYGEALQKASFENFNFKFYDEASDERATAVKTVRAAKEFASTILAGERAKGLMLIGNIGSGKTHLAAAITNTLKAHHIKVMFTVVPDLLDELRATYKNDELNENDIMDTAKNAPLLILDDLGAHNYTDWTRNKLFSLLNHRMTHLLPTIITTNLDMNELEEYLGERTTSRIVELCKIYRLNVHKDIRFQKNLKK